MKRLVISFISIFSIVFISQAAPTIFTVTNNGDAGTGVGTAGDLRYCINQAAATAVGPHTIIFNTAMTITINSDLQINAGNHNGITINGFVDGIDGPDVIIRSNVVLTNQMLFNNTVGANVYGLVFQNLDYGIHFNTATNCVVKGCYFGTDATGLAIIGGINQAGIFVQNGGVTANNIIGGLATTLPNGTNTSVNNSERCIFAGCSQKTNAGAGIRVPALLVRDAGGTQVINNYFGVDVTGAVRLGNGNQTIKMPLAHAAIYMNNATNSVIDRNVISASTGSGIHLENWCNNTKIKGNKIGTNATATAAFNATPSLAFGNEACGIFIQSGSGIVIGYDGGTIANERNIIAGNGGAKHNNWETTCDAGFSDFNQYGIYTESMISAIIKGNYIGTDITGNSSGVNNVFGNRAGGIKMVTINGVGNGNSINNIIGGGATVNDRNIISGNGYLWKASDNTSTCNGGTPNPSGITGGPGVLFQYAKTTTNIVSGNYIGLGADGVTKLGNNQSGIEILGAASNTIGTPTQPNYISDNTWGIFLQVDYGTPFVPAINNTISGNIIGLTTTNAAAGNGQRPGLTDGGGIGMQMGVSGNSIGTAVVNGGNVISANRIGISIQTNSTTAGATAPTNNTIYNNIIGLDPTGTTAIPNTSSATGYGYGIKIEIGPTGIVFPFGNVIGGIGANQSNTISGNQKSGIYIASTIAATASTANSIVGNNIGTNLAGIADVGNTLQGIEIVNVSKTTITSNYISGNDQNGISLTASSGNTILSNIIGLGKTAPIPNGANGIALSGSSSNTISSNTISSNVSDGIALLGSSANTIQGNTISSNGFDGISLVAASANNIIGGSQANTISNNGRNGVVVNGGGSIHNSIHANSFSCNALRGIVLSAGGNNSYAAPTIVGTPTQLTFTGSTGTSFIEVYETDGCATCATGTSINLQGKILKASGPSPFNFTIALGFDKTKTYTALSHEASGATAHNTSEFSGCYTVCKDPTSVAISASGPVTFCASGSVTLTAVITGGIGTPTYQWKRGATVLTGETNSTYVASVAGSYVVLYNSDQACGADIPSAATTVVVNPNPVITDQTPAAICSGTAFTVSPSGAGVPAGTTYTWTAPVITGGLTGSSAQATDQASISQTLTNPGTSTGTAVYTVTPKSGAGCIGVTFKVTVTVNPKATVTTINPAAICSGATTTISLTSGTASSTFAWTIGTVSSGVSGQSAGNGTTIAQTLDNNAITAGTVQYLVTPTFGGCAGIAKTITVTVNPIATVTTTDPVAICSGATTAISLTSASAPTTFAWTIGTVSSGVSGQLAANGTSIAQALTNNGVSAGTVQYIITPTFGGCAGTAKTITATVNPKATVTTTDPAAICSGATTAISLTSGTASSTFAWTIGTVSLGISGQSAGSGTSIAQILNNNAASAGTVQYIVTPTFGGCTGTAKTITVTVNPITTITTTDPAAICSGATTAISLTSNSGSAGFSWTIGTVSPGVSGQSAGNGTSIDQALNNTGVSAGTVQYIVTPTFGACDGTAKTITVTVNPVATVTTTDPAAICSGATTAISLTSNTSSTTFAWTIGAGTSSSISGQSASSGATIAQTLTNSSNSAVGKVEYIVTPTIGTCTGTAKTITVSVNPVAIITVPNTKAICSGSSTDITLSSSVSSASYTWTIGTVIGAVGQSAGIGSTIDQLLTTTSTTVAGSVEYSVTASFGSCGGDATTIKVTVNPKPVTGITASGPTTFCTGGSSQLTAVAAGFAGGTFEWFHDGISIGSQNPKTVGAEGDYVAVYTTVGLCVSNNSNIITITITPNTSPVTAQLDSVTTCLDNILLVANRPWVGTGTWSIYAPNPALPAELISVPNRSVDSMQAIKLVNGISYKFLYTNTSGCGPDQSDTVFVKVGVDDFGLTASAPADTLCFKTKRSLSAQVTGKGGSGDYNYVWVGNDGTTITTKNSVLVVSPTHQTTEYVVYVEDLKYIGCKTNEVPLTLNAIDGQKLYVPNLITPNDDNKNEIFYLSDRTTYPGIEMPLIKEGCHLIVFNRWGDKVFEANNYENNWNPKDLTDGVYYYQISTSCGNKEYKSWLQILGNKNN